MKRAAAVLALLLLSLGTAGCALFRPSLPEATNRVHELLEGVVEAVASAGVTVPEPLVSAHPCADPFFGPRQGSRPYVAYSFPLADFEDPVEILRLAEQAWEQMGMDIVIEDVGYAEFRYSGRRGYGVTASVNYNNQEVLLTGTGPCVDAPDR